LYRLRWVVLLGVLAVGSPSLGAEPASFPKKAPERGTLPGFGILGNATPTPITADADRKGTERLLCGERITGNWGGVRTQFEEHGLEVGLFLTTIWQRNFGEGLNTAGAGAFTGSYDLELTLDLEGLVKLQGLQMYVLAEGSWNDGIDESDVSSLMGINEDAAGDRAIDVTQLWFQQNCWDDKVRIRVGKTDLSGSFQCRHCDVAFDCTWYACDETSQFLAGPLTGNPQIPFPDNGLGVALYVEPVPGFYLSAGVADADADARETGFRTTFSGPDHFTSVYEVGVVPDVPCPFTSQDLLGHYAVGMWLDGMPKQRIGSDPVSHKRDDIGFYVTISQQLIKEPHADPDGEQGLGLFFRYGFAPQGTNEIEDFWSVGGQYKGLIPGRDDDVVGVGVAQGILSDRLDRTGVVPQKETVYELYYNVQVCPSTNLSCGYQIVDNPGGLGGADRIGDANVLYVRLQVAF